MSGKGAVHEGDPQSVKRLRGYSRYREGLWLQSPFILRYASISSFKCLRLPLNHFGMPQVDHFATIKEYSRSSADQEEPLPHELRPLPVLSMTMDYLVTQVMDQGEGNYRDWYDFVWNRTRGIRKVGITLIALILNDELCSP